MLEADLFAWFLDGGKAVKRARVCVLACSVRDSLTRFPSLLPPPPPPPSSYDEVSPAV